MESKKQMSSDGNKQDAETFQLSRPEATRLRIVFQQLCELRDKYFDSSINHFQLLSERPQKSRSKTSQKSTYRKKKKSKNLSKHSQFFSAREVAEQLKFLRSKWKNKRKQKPRFTKSEIDLMIWEVDEDLDGRVIWAEFELMFKKCMKDERDRNGLEPRALYNLVRFMMFDQSRCGEINAENTYELLYVRWKVNDEYFQEKRKLQEKQHIDMKSMPYVISFDEQIYELFNFRPVDNQKVLTNPDLEVRLTFFEYLDKINDLAIQHRQEKKKKMIQDFAKQK